MESAFSPTRWLVALLMTFFAAPLLHAQSTQPSVEDRVRKMSATLGAATMLSFEAEVLLDEPSASGQMVEYSRHLTLQIRRPGELKAIVKGDREDYSVYLDGKRFLIFDPDRKIFATFAVPDTLDAALPVLNQKKGFATPLSNFLLSNPSATFTAQAQSSERIGNSVIDGITCDHLAIRQVDTDVQLWLEQNEQSLPRKLVINYKKPAGGIVQLSATLSKWDLLPTLTDATFQFTPPSDAQEKSLADVKPAVSQAPSSRH